MPADKNSSTTKSEESVKGAIERGILALGKSIIGVDEVGRGCLAGPVFAGCASLDYTKLHALSDKERALIRDSKTLSSKQRSQIIPTIHEICVEYAIEKAEVHEIEKYGIVGATFLAMKRALIKCLGNYSIVLTDGNKIIPNLPQEQQAIVKGDNLCFCIAAASILAKQKRDLFMFDQATRYPHYGFDQHVGYGTKQHIEAIHRHGICPLHRRNFAPINQMAGQTTS